MNERIRELLNEATVGLEPDLSPQRTVTLNELEKFAELIVKECLTLCEHESNDDPHDEYDMGMFVKAGAISDRIKHHFGVEE